MASLWSLITHPIVLMVIEILVIVVVLLLSVAYFTYWERKVLAWVQLRKGPNVVGPFGLLQPIADGLKLLMKETVIPSGANQVVFVAAPILTFSLSLIAWAVIPFDFGGDQPLALRSRRGRVRAGGGILRRVLLDGLRAVLPRRIREHDPGEHD